jgi:hypothetical protein
MSRALIVQGLHGLDEKACWGAEPAKLGTRESVAWNQFTRGCASTGGHMQHILGLGVSRERFRPLCRSISCALALPPAWPTHRFDGSPSSWTFHTVTSLILNPGCNGTHTHYCVSGGQMLRWTRRNQCAATLTRTSTQTGRVFPTKNSARHYIAVRIRSLSRSAGGAPAPRGRPLWRFGARAA